MILVLVALGGALGAVARFFLDSELKGRVSSPWAVGTFIINVLGSFVLGFALARHPSEQVVAFLTTGICGGFTTFSTASVETVAELRNRGILIALTYAGGMLAACVAACTLGGAIG